MIRRAFIAAGALTLLGVGAAQAQTAPRLRAPEAAPAFSTRGADVAPDNQWGPQAGRNSVAWDQRGRWGVRLDLQQPIGRERELSDVEAGGFVRLNRSVSVGGAVRLEDVPARARDLTPRDRNPQVRVEGRIRF